MTGTAAAKMTRFWSICANQSTGILTKFLAGRQIGLGVGLRAPVIPDHPPARVATARGRPTGATCPTFRHGPVGKGAPCRDSSEEDAASVASGSLPWVAVCTQVAFAEKGRS